MTEREYMTMSEPARPGLPHTDWPPYPEAPERADRFCRPMYWPRLQASYFQALGALRVLSEQFDPHVRLWCGVSGQDWRFQYDAVEVEVEEFFRATYRPSTVYSPWNARAFGSGFAKTLAAARRVPQLSRYCAAVDRAAELGMAGKPEGAAKTSLVLDLLSRNTVLDETHAQWVRACWRMDVPDPPKPRGPKAKGPTPKQKPNDVKARVVLGAGGCAGSGDYGSAFLRAALLHFGAKLPAGVSRDLPTGGFAWPDNGYYPSPLDVLLTLEGATGFAFPWAADDPFAVVLPTPWHVPGPEGEGYGRLWLPFWEGGLTWAEVRKMLASGWAWDPRRRVVRPPAVYTADVHWTKDGDVNRMSWGKEGQTALRPVWRPVDVVLTLAYSPDEGEQWCSSVEVDGQSVWSSDLGEYECVRDEAEYLIKNEYGDRATVTELRVTV